MARFSGKAGSIALSTPATTHNVAVTSWEVDTKSDAVDTTGMDNAGVKTFIPGLTDWSGSFEGQVNGSLAALYALLSAGTPTTAFTLQASATADAPKLTAGAGPPAGQILITGVRMSTAHDGTAKVTCTFQGSGVLTVGVVT